MLSKLLCEHIHSKIKLYLHCLHCGQVREIKNKNKIKTPLTLTQTMTDYKIKTEH